MKRKPKKTMSVWDFLETRYTLKRPLSAGGLHQYRVAVQSLDAWSGTAVTCDELCDDLVNNWLAHLERRPLSRVTIRNRRRHMLTLWHAACKEGLCRSKANEVRLCPVPYLAPRAWTHADVCRLLRAAEALEGQFPSERWKTGVKWRLPRSVLFSLLIRIGWDSGLRLGDLLLLKPGVFAADGTFEIVQAKTRRWHISRVHKTTLQEIRESFPPERDYVVPWRCSLRWFDLEWQKLVKLAGVPAGPFKKIRKSSATDVEMHHPGCGSAHLGHVSEQGIAGKHYLDPRLLIDAKPMPRELRPVGIEGALVRPKRRRKAGAA